MKKSVTEMKSAFDALIIRQHSQGKNQSLKICQQTFFKQTVNIIGIPEEERTKEIFEVIIADIF